MRFASRNKASDASLTVQMTGGHERVEVVKCPSHVNHYRLARCREGDTKTTSFQKRHAEVVLQASYPSA
jgi:hypothetical protein